MSCPLCQLGTDDDFPVMDLSLDDDRFVRNPDAPEDQQQTDYVEVTRAVRTEFGINTTTASVKQHLNEHIVFSIPDPDGGRGDGS